MTGPEKLLKEVLLLTAVGETMSLQEEHPIQGQFFHLLKCNKVHLIRSLPLCSGGGEFMLPGMNIFMYGKMCAKWHE